MMRSMRIRKPPDRAGGERQPDLFDERGRRDADGAPAPMVTPAGPPAGELTDGELIAMLPEASRSTVEALCAEVVSRSLDEAVPALEALWRRFAGFGIGSPLIEQLSVLGALGRLDGEASRAALRRIVLSKGLPASLLPAALRAAAQTGHSLPAGFVASLLGHEDTAVRESAFALAPKTRIRGDQLRDGLTDPSASVRRLAAIAMGDRGDAEAMECLIDELERAPSREVIEALASIGGDDVVVHLSRCAERHSSLAGTVVDTLRDMENAKAARLARRLEAGVRGRLKEGR